MTLAFRLGSIPVRVHPSFLITALLLGGGYMQNGRLLLAWVAVVFVSVMLHELGHALVGRAFGLTPEIDLQGMGGLTSWSAGRNVSHVRSILISLAGPFTGLAVGALVWAVGHSSGFLPEPGEPPELRHEVYSQILYANIVWSIFNLVPMLPLDGGNVMRSTLNLAMKGKGDRPAFIVSIVIAAGIGAVAWFWRGDWWIALLAAMFAFQNVQALRQIADRETDTTLKSDFAAAYDALKREDGKAVIRIADSLLTRVRTNEARAEATHLYAFGLLLDGRVDAADAMIAKLPPGYSPHASYGELRDTVIGAGHA